MGSYKTTVHKFGPGSLESLTLRLWRHRRNHDHIIARLEGWYTVYCGAGNEHAVSISQEADAWENENWNSASWFAPRLLRAFKGDVESARDLAAEMVEWTFDGNEWTDPCDNLEEPLDFSDRQE